MADHETPCPAPALSRAQRQWLIDLLEREYARAEQPLAARLAAQMYDLFCDSQRWVLSNPLIETHCHVPSCQYPAVGFSIAGYPVCAFHKLGYDRLLATRRVSDPGHACAGGTMHVRRGAALYAFGSTLLCEDCLAEIDEADIRLIRAVTMAREREQVEQRLQASIDQVQASLTDATSPAPSPGDGT